MKAFVTGASGFIGSHLVDRLVSMGVEVRALMRTTSSKKYLPKSVRVIHGDLFDLHALSEGAKEADWIFHLAGIVSSHQKSDFHQINVEGTRNLVQVVRSQGGIKRFIFVSSLAAGGPSFDRKLRKEVDQDSPVSEYGKSKLEAEKILLQVKDEIPLVIIRPPLVYGPRDTEVFLFFKSVTRGIVPILKGNEQKLYSFVHSHDLCNFMITAAQKEVPSGEIFYVCSQEKVSSDEMIDLISTHLKKRPLRIPVGPKTTRLAVLSLAAFSRWFGFRVPITRDKWNEIRPDCWICSNEKAENLLGFKPTVDLNTGMADVANWYKNHHWI